jgi:translation elongation factor EF-Tu-like GTPase
VELNKVEMTILKKIENNELYLYLNGNLIYKRWLDTGQSLVFDVKVYDKYTLTSIRDLVFENPNGLITIKAKLKLKTTAAGGRKTGFISGYRPNHVFEYKDNEMLQAYIGDIVFDDQSTIEPGEEKIVTVRFSLNQQIEKYLYKGCIWWIQEGENLTGEAEIL